MLMYLKISTLCQSLWVQDSMTPNTAIPESCGTMLQTTSTLETCKSVTGHVLIRNETLSLKA